MRSMCLVGRLVWTTFFPYIWSRSCLMRSLVCPPDRPFLSWHFRWVFFRCYFSPFSVHCCTTCGYCIATILGKIDWSNEWWRIREKMAYHAWDTFHRFHFEHFDLNLFLLQSACVCVWVCLAWELRAQSIQCNCTNESKAQYRLFVCFFLANIQPGHTPIPNNTSTMNTNQHLLHVGVTQCRQVVSRDNANCKYKIKGKHRANGHAKQAGSDSSNEERNFN